ncbi:hut operon transcriptional regulator HutP [Paenibacillus albiflavus]
MISIDMNSFSLGKLTCLLAMLHNDSWGKEVEDELKTRGYRYTIGKVGSMDIVKVVAAIETAAKSKHIIDEGHYREAHALYHATIEAIQGIGRGTIQFGEILRTVGLTFAIVRGTVDRPGHDGEWISVCVFGSIGAPKKGFEHDTLGFGYNHI